MPGVAVMRTYTCDTGRRVTNDARQGDATYVWQTRDRKEEARAL